MKKIAFLFTVIFLIMANVCASANHIPVLLYHDVQYSYTADKAAVTITPQKFEEHISTLLKNGYTPISFEDAYNASLGKFKMPEKPVIISFDDGYDTNYKYAFPIIQKYRVKTTIFVVVDTVGQVLQNSVHFSWQQAKEMQKSGLVSIQSHTLNHYDLTELDRFQLERELRMSKYLVEKNLGTDCDIVAFPYGHHNQTVSDVAERAGYRIMAQVGENGVNNVADFGTKPLVRVTVYGSWSGQDLIGVMKANAKQ